MLRLASSMTATVLAPDWRRTSRTTVGTPLSRAVDRCSRVPSSAHPRSRTRAGDPPARGGGRALAGTPPVRTPPHADRAPQPADDPHLAHARGSLQADLHHLVGQLGPFAKRPVPGQ